MSILDKTILFMAPVKPEMHFRRKKILITPHPNHLRALFFFFSLFFSFSASAQSTLDSLIDWVNTHPHNDSIRVHKLHRISYMLSETDVSRAFEYYKKVEAISDSMNFTFGKAIAQVNLGILLTSSGNFESSTNAYFKAIDLAKACNANRVEAVCLNNIGENFASQKDFDKCRRYALMALDINRRLKAARGVAINYELIARCDFEQRDYTDSRKNLDIGMTWARQANENYIYSQFYLGYGKLMAVENQTDSAKYFFDKAIASARETGDLRNEFQVFLAEAQYLKHIPAKNRISLLQQAMLLARQTHYMEGQARSAEQLSAAYDAINNKDSSLFYYRVFRRVSDSLFSENNQWNMIVKESEWTNRQKELENRNLKQITAAQEKQLAFKNILLVVGTLGFGLVLIVAFLLFKSYRSKKSKDEFQYKQKIAETEMQALQAQMNPHFFFNSLNSIENFIMQNEKKLASDYLNKFARFIRSILDSSNNDLIELNKDLESLQLYIDLEQLRFNHKFRYFCQVDPPLQDGEFHVPALLVQPFLENAINHGIGPSDRKDLKICLKVKLKDNYIHYIIENNSIGREQSGIYKQINKPYHKSIGMKLTQDRINIFNQENGTTSNLKILDLYDENQKPAGTRIEFYIKAVTHAVAESHTGR